MSSSDRIRQQTLSSAAIALSAQNLAFSPPPPSSVNTNSTPQFPPNANHFHNHPGAGFVGQQQNNIGQAAYYHQYQYQQQQQQTNNNAAMIEMERQARKMREYEHQRSKLQRWNVVKSSSSSSTTAKNSSTTVNSDPDAMIAQIVGKPLASANSAFANRTLPPVSATNFYGGHQQPSSAGSSYYTTCTTATTTNITNPTDAPMTKFNFTSANHRPAGSQQQFVSPSSESVGGGALQFTPREFESMMNHVAAMQFGNPPAPSSSPSESQNYRHHQNSQPAAPPISSGVFVIPNGQYHHHHHSASTPMPAWTRDESRLPEEYRRYYQLCLTNPSRGGSNLPDLSSQTPQQLLLPDTGLVYVLLRTSGLSNEVLGTIWTLTNRSYPGQLTKEEFYACLALIALAQETGAISSWDAVCNLTKPPIPRLSIITDQQHSSVDQQQQLIAAAATINKSAIVSSPAPTTISNNSAADTNFSNNNNNSNDDFGEFTDFQAAAPPLQTLPNSSPLPPAVVEKKENDSAAEDLDKKYDALRALADPLDVVDDCHRNRITTDADQQSDQSHDQEMDKRSAAAGESSKFGQFGEDKSIGGDTHLFESKSIGGIVQFDSKSMIGGFHQSESKSITGGELLHSSKSIEDQQLGISKSTSFSEPKTAFVTKDFHQKRGINDLLREVSAALDFGGAASVKSEDDTGSVKSGSKEPSVHSLDLHSIKQFDLDKETGLDNHGIQSPDNTRSTWSPAASGSGSGGTNNNNNISLVDRYAAFRENANTINGEHSLAEKHVIAWTKCLEACLQLLKQAEKLFSDAGDDTIRKEILSTDRGAKYLCGNVQIYRVYRRIRLSLQTTAFQTDKVIELLTEIEATWTRLGSMVSFSGLLEKLNFRNSVIQPNNSKDGKSNHHQIQDRERNSLISCGVCLLNVDADSCRTDRGTSTCFDYKLTYGGRQYHAQCANLWINCIDSVLPALEIPSLL